jgi:oligoribonuclease NrnB/cAMP/cGMP phosphodiesterase (DHH superfamily)
MTFVLYHSNCYDGFGAAWAAWLKFGDGAKYIPVSYGYPPPEMPDAKTIYILDFSYDAVTILNLSLKAQVVVLDHHKTAQADLEQLMRTDHNGPPNEIFNPHIVFDMNRSGALIAWQFFHPEAVVPALIRHISDRDLWQFKIEGSDLVHSALLSYPFDFEVWNKLSESMGKLKDEGVTCERMQEALVGKIVKGSWLGKVANHEVPIVNTTISWSEVGEALLDKHPDAPFAASFTVFHDQVMWSLRSKGDFDVSEIAKKFGGGGHKNAAGYKTTRY